MSRRGIRQLAFGAFVAFLTIVVAFTLIIVPAALPKLNMARRYAEEAAAVKAIQSINTAQMKYNSTFGRFATSLTELGPPTSGTANATSADLISSDLASGEKQGYRFTLKPIPTGYTVKAVPIASRSPRSRTFFSDQSLVIRENYGPEPAAVNSREVGQALSPANGALKSAP